MSFLTKEFLAPGGSRPALDRALGQLRPGDVLVTWRLDRLGRSLSHLIHVVAAPPVHPRVCGEHSAAIASRPLYSIWEEVDRKHRVRGRKAVAP
ncbi:recombinase family protein [Hyphomicrobium zavarzinii]|uniref:recombinase family protein n=1 Tax=Hyphomicrobium zavarzinii TaxID=48292 RepID=UPI003CC90C9E